MTPDMQRLLDYANKFVPNGEWTPNGEDAEESLNNLEEMGLIERNEDGTKFRLNPDAIEEPEKLKIEYDDNADNIIEKVNDALASKKLRFKEDGQLYDGFMIYNLVNF